MQAKRTANIELKEQTERPGYKKTKLGWIPEEWEVVSLKDISIINPKNEKLPAEFTYVDLESVNNGQFNGGTKMFEKEAPSRAQRVLVKRDILFQTVRPYQRNNLFFDKNGDYVASTGYAQIRAKQSDMFLFQLLHSDYFVNQVLRRCTGTSYPAISSSDLAEVRIKFPPLPEQQKIAKILSTSDTAIATQEQLIVAKETFKKGLMQVLLTGEKRFKGFEGEWEECTLNECCSVKGKYGIGAAAVNFSNNLPRYLRITDINDDGQYSPDKEVCVDENGWEDYILAEGDIVFARTGNTTGKSYLFNPKDGVLVYAGFLIKFRPKKNVLNPAFLKYYTETKPYWDWVKTMSVRSGQPGINSVEYGKLKLPLPCIEEQQKIASVLRDADKEIELLKQQLAQLQDQKRGLMQRLLTGVVRVKID